MILLSPDQYFKVTPYLNEVSFNSLFARAVIDRRVSGRVYADETDNPKTFYIVHAYGMSLLLGDYNNQPFNTAFKDYALKGSGNTYEWMQTYPAEWETVLKDLFAGVLIPATENTGQHAKPIVELNTRVNFRFNHARYLSTKKTDNDPEIRIVQNNHEVYEQMKGSVVPRYFWDSAEDFQKNGIGYCLYVEGQLAATAFSSFVYHDKLELGIETIPEHRGKGLAQKVCAALIDYCLENNLEPIWACRLENTGSYKLAQKLGFEPALYLPYYRLNP